MVIGLSWISEFYYTSSEYFSFFKNIFLKKYLVYKVFLIVKNSYKKVIMYYGIYNIINSNYMYKMKITSQMLKWKKEK